jgi:hypothetical protein
MAVHETLKNMKTIHLIVRVGMHKKLNKKLHLPK